MISFRQFLEDDTYYTAHRTVGSQKEGPSLGTYFTTDRKIAGGYGNVIRSASLKIQHPCRIPPNNLPAADGKPWFDSFNDEEVNALLKQLGIRFKFPVEDDWREEFWRFIDEGGRRFIGDVKKADYDALIYPDSQGARQFMTTLVFDPNLMNFHGAS